MSLQGGIELRKPDKVDPPLICRCILVLSAAQIMLAFRCSSYVRWTQLGEVENKQAAYMRAAIDENTLAHCEQVVEEWCSQTEGLLAESEENRREPEDAGPGHLLCLTRCKARFSALRNHLATRVIAYFCHAAIDRGCIYSMSASSGLQAKEVSFKLIDSGLASGDGLGSHTPSDPELSRAISVLSSQIRS